MNCNEAGTLLAAYGDGELDGARHRSIESHLHDCAGCRAKRQSALDLCQRLRSELPYFAAPRALRARVRAMRAQVRTPMGTQVGSETRAPLPARLLAMSDRWRWLSAGTLAGCTATMLAWSVGTAVVDWRANEDLAGEAVSSHVRATLNNHLIEVASSNQHTVKPWLSARLDYSPPVQDLAGEGFLLVGGRLDMLDKRPIATLVYSHRQHTIDVFVRPASGHASPELQGSRGFNVARASGGGMDWIAVSDVSADVLAAFAQRLAQADTP